MLIPNFLIKAELAPLVFFNLDNKLNFVLQLESRLLQDVVNHDEGILKHQKETSMGRVVDHFEVSVRSREFAFYF